MHGNEVVGREMLLLLVHLLCENYGSNDFVTGMVNLTRIHIMPTMNPDGYARGTLGKFPIGDNYPDISLKPDVFARGFYDNV